MTSEPPSLSMPLVPSKLVKEAGNSRAGAEYPLDGLATLTALLQSTQAARCVAFWPK